MEPLMEVKLDCGINHIPFMGSIKVYLEAPQPTGQLDPSRRHIDGPFSCRRAVDCALIWPVPISVELKCWDPH